MKHARLVATVLVVLPATLAALAAGGPGLTGSRPEAGAPNPAPPVARHSELRLPDRQERYRRLGQAMAAEIDAYQAQRSRLARVHARAVADGDGATKQNVERIAERLWHEHRQRLDGLRRSTRTWLDHRPHRQVAGTRSVATAIAAPGAPAAAAPAATAPDDGRWQELQATALERVTAETWHRVRARPGGPASTTGVASRTVLDSPRPLEQFGFSVNRSRLRQAQERARNERAARRLAGAG